MLALALPSGMARAERPTGAAEWITLGTGGGPVIRRERAEPANALRAGDAIYLFDIGAGTQKRLAEAGIDPAAVRAIFLSHLHIDHTADLGPFLLNRWVLNTYAPVAVIGPRGTRLTLEGAKLASEPVRLAPVRIGGPPKPAFTATFAATELAPEMDRPTLIYHDANIRVLAVTNRHYNFPAHTLEARHARSYAFRIETADRTFVFTGDTGMSDHLVDLARGADVLVSEVIDMAGIERTLRRAGTVPPAVLPGLLAHMRHDHLTPPQIGDIARRAGVGRVVLTHLVPGEDGETDLSAYLRGLAQAYPGPVTIAHDLDRF